MKFVAITLLLLTSIFLIACSANQASNKISNSELENLASKYGGVYIFNQKFVEEIEKREKERSDYMDDFFRNNKRNFKRDDLAIMDKKLPQTLSNGKKYYENSTAYENQTGKKVKIPAEYKEKVINFIGIDNYNKSKPGFDLGYFCIDKDDNIEVIDMTVDYYVTKTDYGLYGDEGMGFSFKKNRYVNISGDNKFILVNGKFERASKDK
ncbi:tRNA 2-selenouridine synthase [Campylobacter concisus]|uniref:tRNA 2-selenouridine synthase n=1 Tax=Campylobacter concisus TaxID=199 RepID=UPI0018833290|nr:tRNA 2-selenouridine synthase [Campylobacter concisus]MBE9836462.1 tRNA 2-selenouridine synthase [Campylobacter concisus]